MLNPNKHVFEHVVWGMVLGFLLSWYSFYLVQGLKGSLWGVQQGGQKVVKSLLVETR
jgi:hypothetical protein